MKELVKRIFINPISIVAEIIIVAIYAVLIILHTDDTMAIASGILVSATILPVLLCMVFFIWISIPYWKIAKVVEGFDMIGVFIAIMGLTSMALFAGVGTVEAVVEIIKLLL